MKQEHLKLRFRALIRENKDLTRACLIWPREEGTVEFTGRFEILEGNPNIVNFHSDAIDAGPIGFGIHDISSLTLHYHSPGLTITLKP